MRLALAKHWFFIGIAAAIALAFSCPALGETFRRYHVLKAAIFAAFLITGLTLHTGQIIDEIRNFKALSALLISCFVIFPLIAFGLANIFFPGNKDMIVGACILGVAPATIASGTVLTGMARGNVSLSLLICVATSLLGIFTIPFSLKILLQSEQHIQLPALQMIRSLLTIALLPTIIGQILRIRLRNVVIAWRKGLSIFSQFVVLMIIFNAVSKSTNQITQMGMRVVLIFLFMMGLHAIMLLVNFAISKLIRLDRPSTSAFTIHTSQKTLTLSFIVWDGYFTQFAMAMIPNIVHHLTQLIADTALGPTV